MVIETQPQTPPHSGYTKKDFMSDQEVRWCPGCGDYSILAQMQKTMPNLGVAREKVVFVSGIGCSSRFPYYMNTYGFHSIHGRAPTIASGLKVTRPDLQVWVVTGDGDGLSIGGNHLLHVLRRNMDLKIVLFNNRVYGLTKGQYSPTSEIGMKTKSSPLGTIETPINPISLALAAEATFVARTLDNDPAHLMETIEQAAAHKGSAFIEVYQNCLIFNDATFDAFSAKPVRAERMLYLAHGKPMLFGNDHERGIRLNGLEPEIVPVQGESAGEILVHDTHRPEPTVANFLARMQYPTMPVPVGVFRQVERPAYHELLDQQIAEASARRGPTDWQALLNGETTWTVE